MTQHAAAEIVRSTGERFVIADMLGEGRLGRVFRARDTVGQMDVALKVLQRVGAEGVASLKHEFRLVADIAHPNLVELFELVTSGDDAFVSMELVRGPTLMEYLGSDTSGSLTSQRLARIVEAAKQLAAGLHALHLANRLHRDVKPANVLVSEHGRVVLVDFDLGAALEPGQKRAETEGMVGTAAYVAEEQLWGKAVPASDWYSVGVLVFEALTGRLPSAALRGKPSAYVSGVPAALDDLVVRLLNPAAEKRPGHAEVVRVLSGLVAPAGAEPTVPVHFKEPGFVGRSAELARLDGIWESARSRTPALVRVTGPSGIGKSALVRQWIASLKERPLAFHGRCDPHESVPYRGIDTVIDTIATEVLRRPDRVPAALLEGLMPLFPGLQTNASVERHEGAGTRTRERALEALRQILTELSPEGVIVWIDDLQWTSRDTMDLLLELLGDPRTPPILTVLSDRGFETFDEALRARLGMGADRIRREEIALAPLPASEVHELLSAMTPEGALTEATRSDIVDDAGGSPFVVKELARWCIVGGTDTRAAPKDNVLSARLGALPDRARALLEIVALAALPMPRRVALEVAGIAAEEPWLPLLRSERFVRRSPEGEQPSLETTHDRIREVVSREIESKRRRVLHKSVAEVLERDPRTGDALKLHHWIEAGEGKRALPYALAAAERAEAVQAFNRASELYGRCVDLLGAASVDHEVHVRHGRALALAGRTEDAARAYEHALADRSMDSAQRSALLRERAEQYLRGGHRELGLDALKESLAMEGIAFPRSSAAALAAVLANRFHIWRLGNGLRHRPRHHRADELARRSDASWSAGLGLNMIDMMRSFAFQTLHVRLAFESGDDLRVLYALSSEVVYRACEGGAANEARGAALTARAREQAIRVGSKDATAMMQLSFGVGEYFRGKFDACMRSLAAAHDAFAARHEGITWEILNCHMYRFWSLRWRGELRKLRHEIDPAVATARRLGNRLAEVALTNAHGNLALLAYEGPEEARRVADAAMVHFPGTDFQSPHYMQLLALAQIELATDRGEEAWRRVDAAWPHLDKLGFFRMEFFRTELRYLRACAALAASREAGFLARRRLLREVASTQRLIARDLLPVAQAYAAILRDALASHRGAKAIDLGESIALATKAELHMHAALLRTQARADDGGWAEAQGIERAGLLAKAVLPPSPG